MVPTNNYILYVEDSTPDVYLLREVLQQMDPNFEVFAVSYGREVLSFLEKQMDSLPCLIILDLLLPDVNGKEVLHDLKLHPIFSQIPVLITTGFDDQKEKENCIALGADFFMSKKNNYELAEKELMEILDYFLKEQKV